MNIHEYQAKELLDKFGVTNTPGGVASTPEEAEKGARSLSTNNLVVKAQVHAGGRGKGTFTNGFQGGVHLCKTANQVRELLRTTTASDRAGGYGPRHGFGSLSLATALLKLRGNPAVLVSGLTGEGIGRLFDQIDAVLAFDTVETVRFRIPLRDGASIALLHEGGKVRSEAYHGNVCEIVVEAPESLRRRLHRYLLRNSTEPVENSVHN